MFFPTVFGSLGDVLYFSGNDGNTGYELWQSDGTEQGTVQVEDINPGSDGSWPKELTRVGDMLLFAAHNEDFGAELWAVRAHSYAIYVPVVVQNFAR